MKLIRFIIGILLYFVIGFSHAQNNLNLTFRPCANFPTKDFGETKLKNGGGFEATVAYSFRSHFQAYGGYSWNSFNEKSSPDDLKFTYKETGYGLGIQFFLPFSSTSKINFIFGAGGLYNQMEIENELGDNFPDTKYELGWQVETGLIIPVGHHDRCQLQPTILYRNSSWDITNEEIKSSVDLNYFSVGLGVNWIILKAE